MSSDSIDEKVQKARSAPGTKARASQRQLMARWGWFGIALDGTAVIRSPEGEERWRRVSGQGDSSTWELT